MTLTKTKFDDVFFSEISDPNPDFRRIVESALASGLDNLEKVIAKIESMEDTTTVKKYITKHFKDLNFFKFEIYYMLKKLKEDNNEEKAEAEI